MLLDIHGLQGGYTTHNIINDVSLSVDAGQIQALIGPNGAGKTTIIRAISGVLPYVAGDIFVQGDCMAALTPIERARRIAVVPQARQLGGAYTVRQAVMMGRTAYMGWLGRECRRDEDAVEAALAQTQLTDFADRQIARLSGGEQQRVLLARALAQETPVLLLDEPTNHLDLRHQTDLLRLIRRLVKEKGLAVLFAMHDLNLVSAIADQVALLVDGHIDVFGPPAHVLTAKTISAAYGVRVSVVQHPDNGSRVIFPPELTGQESERYPND